MCGIAGIIGPDVAALHRSIVSGMLATLASRGPDESGLMVFPHCILGHTRLSILDLATGSQPMKDNSGAIAITFNGEIYNFQELRTELLSKGYSFSTRSDTEVILKAYLEYGAQCPEYLDGMFAFGIWDENETSLFLARDRFGKKPLYYAFDQDGNLVFGSELKALLASGRIASIIDYDAIDNYLRFAYIPPWQTVYKNIYVVKPGESVVFRAGQVSTRKYWTLKHEPVKISYADAKEEVRRLLEDAVQKRMVADVEIGALLSGGVDSTIVTAVAQKYASKPIKTFSVGYGDYVNELPYSRAASEKLGTDHYILQVGGGELIEEVQKVTAYFDEPHADSSNVAQFLVSRLAGTKVKVALCGDGGDEAFLGYSWYWNHWLQGRRKRLEQFLFSSIFQDYLKTVEFFSSAKRTHLWNRNVPALSDFFPAEIKRASLRGVQKINLFDLLVYLPGQLLVKADRAGMMNSLEVRSPLLDHKLVEFVFNLPVQYKTDRTRGKLILKDLLREIMPAEFVDRKKVGFGAPVRDWLRTICKPLVYDLFSSRNAKVYDCMDRRFIQSMIDSFYSGYDSSSYVKIWILLCLELWFDSHHGDAPHRAEMDVRKTAQT